MREVEARLKITGQDRTGRMFSTLAGKMDQVDRRAAAFNQRQTAMARTTMAVMASMARYAGPAALAGAAIYSTKAAADFEQALFNIEKKSGASREEMAKLRNEVISLAKELPVSIDEIASGFERGAAAGIPLDELRDFPKLTAGVADAWDSTAEHVGNVFAGFTAGLGMARKDLTSYASLINDLADSGIADETDIADFIDRAGASLKNFGMTPEEIAAYGAALLNLKMPSEVGARAMDTLTGKLLAPENLSPKSSRALVEIVGSMKEFTKLTGNQRLLFFLNRVSALNNQKRAGLLGALLGEGFDDETMRLVAGLPELMRNLAMAQQHVEKPSNSIIDSQNKRLELFNSQLTLLQNNLRSIAIEIGDSLVLPWLSEAMRQVNEALAEMDKRKKAIEGQSPEQVRQDHDRFVKEYLKDNPSTYGSGDLDRANADLAYREAMKRVGEGKLIDVHEYNIQRREDKAYQQRVSDNADQYLLYGQGRAGVNNVLEFPGGGTGQPPVPMPRPNASAEQYRNMREQYELYGEGRANINNTNGQRRDLNTSLPREERRRRLREADPASLGMDGMGGILIEGSRKIESSGEAAGKAIEDGATSVKQAGQDLLASLLNVARQIDSAAAKLQNVRIAGAAIGGQFNDRGHSMPASANLPIGGGGGY
jgi:TP901 family phage tail tape measure protein